MSLPPTFTVKGAAERVGRSERTIRNWLSRGLRSYAGFITESDLLEFERVMRQRVGRPRKDSGVPDKPFIDSLVEAGNDELMEELGPILVTIHEMPRTHSDRERLVRQARAMVWREFGDDTTWLVLAAVMAGVEYVLDLKSGGSGS